ncbi:MAG: HAD family phosphatase [Sedimentisphaerales bacterium]|nr:HAD family phosphatase [Sedimentisphaerales bacterium]
MSKLYGLIFDVDGLIANTEPVNAKVTIRVFEDMFGVRGVRPEDFAAGIGRGAEAFVRAAADVHHVDLTDEQVSRAAQLREQYLIQAMRDEGVPAFPGVLELIHAALAKPEYRLAIATSASLELSHAILDATKVPYERMGYVSGSDVTRKKPDPQVFLLAAGRIDIEPARCVVFEDAPSGVQAGKTAGARCVAVTNSAAAEQLAQADIVCDSLEQITLDTIANLIDAK